MKLDSKPRTVAVPGGPRRRRSRGIEAARQAFEHLSLHATGASNTEWIEGAEASGDARPPVWTATVERVRAVGPHG